MKAFICLFAGTALVSGCASYSGIVPASNDNYIVTKQAATGFPGIGNIKTELLTEAREFCDKKGREFKVVEIQEAKPPYVLGNYPRVELTFSCAPTS